MQCEAGLLFVLNQALESLFENLIGELVLQNQLLLLRDVEARVLDGCLVCLDDLANGHDVLVEADLLLTLLSCEFLFLTSDLEFRLWNLFNQTKAVGNCGGQLN